MQGKLTPLLKFWRAQTAPVEAAGAPLAGFLGGAPLWSLPLFALAGMLAHFAGFGGNSLSDMAVDRGQEEKKDHPLFTGELTVTEAKLSIIACAIGAFLIFALLLSHGPFLIPGMAGFFYVVFGLTYNYLGKRNGWAAMVAISSSFMLFTMAAGTIWTGRLTMPVLAISLYSFALVAYQVGVAGALKDIENLKEHNIMRELGSVAKNGYFLRSDNTFYFSSALCLLKAITLSMVAYLLLGWLWGIVIFFVSFEGFAIYNAKLLRSRKFEHDKRLRIMGMGEALSSLAILLPMAPMLWTAWWPLIPLFILLPGAWFGGLNRLLWKRTGSMFAPGV